jgi:GNAT superfamily N-acetyltransferase
VLETLPESVAFLERRGWSRTGRTDRSSCLDVADANLDGFMGVEDRLNREGVRIATLAEIGTSDGTFLHALHDVEYRFERDIPSSEPQAQEPYELWLERQLHGPGKSPRTFWVALNGAQPVGVARLRLTGGDSAVNGLTGVDPDFRGRGIARALKLKTVEWARENGVRTIFTVNDAENRRMLSINVSLGYRPLPADIEMMLDLQKLDENLSATS